MTFFVTGIEIDKTGKIIQYVRDTITQKTSVLSFPHKHFIPTRSVSRSVFEKGILEQLSNDQKLNELGVTIKGPFLYGRNPSHIKNYTDEEISLHESLGGRYVYVACGPPEMKHYLPKNFIVGSKNDNRNNTQKVAEVAANFPFSSVGEKKFQRTKISPQILFEQNVAVIDTEWRNAPVYDDLFGLAYFTNDEFGNYLLMTDKSPVKELHINNLLGDHTFQVIDGLKDGRACAQKLTELLMEHDPYCCVAHNAPYDFLKLRELGFLMGVPTEQSPEGKKPTSVNAGFFKMIRASGRTVFDAAPFSQSRSWSSNNKQDTVFSFLFPDYFLGTPSSKIDDLLKDFPSYDDLEKAAWSKDPKDRLRWMKYLAMDVIKTYSFVHPHKLGASTPFSPYTINLLHSYLFEVAPERTNLTSDNQLLLDQDHRRKLRALHTHGGTELPTNISLNLFDISKRKLKLYPNKFSYGTHRAKILFVSPYIKAAEFLFKKDDDELLAEIPSLLSESFTSENPAHAIYEIYNNMTQPRLRVFLAQGLESYVKKALYDAQNLMNTWKLHPRALLALNQLRSDPRFKASTAPAAIKDICKHNQIKPSEIKTIINTDWYFSRIFQVKVGEYPKNHTVDFFMQQVSKYEDVIAQYFSRQKIINAGNRFVVVPETANIDDLLEHEVVIDLGVGNVVSVAPRSYIAKLDDDVLPWSEGVLLLNENSQKGHTVPAEKKLMQTIVSHYMTYLDTSFVEQTYNDFVERTNAINDASLEEKMDYLFMFPSVARDYFNYRERAHFLEHVRYKVETGQMKGDKFIYGYALGKDYVQYPEIFDQGHTLDVSRYFTFFFGTNEGRLRKFDKRAGRVIRAILCS